jgi:hypothetical protein
MFEGEVVGVCVCGFAVGIFSFSNSKIEVSLLFHRHAFHPTPQFKTAEPCLECGATCCNRTVTIQKYCEQDKPGKCGLPNQTSFIAD